MEEKINAIISELEELKIQIRKERLERNTRVPIKNKTFTFDRRKGICIVDNNTICLSVLETKFLISILSKKDFFITRKEIVKELYDDDGDKYYYSAIAVIAARLRKKIGNYCSIKGIIGKGYQLVWDKGYGEN